MITVTTPINAICVHKNVYEQTVKEYGETGFVYPLNRAFAQMSLSAIINEIKDKMPDCKYIGVCVDHFSEFNRQANTIHLKALLQNISTILGKRIFIFTTKSYTECAKRLDVSYLSDLDCYFVDEKNLYKKPIKMEEKVVEPKPETTKPKPKNKETKTK